MSRKTAGELSEAFSIKPSELPEVIKMAAKIGRPLFCWGPPGIGKSQITKQVSDELGYDYFEDIRLSQKEPTDLHGIPIPGTDPVDGKTVAYWSPPSFYRKDTQAGSGKKAFYFFDEMNSAPQTVQAASYSIVLDRKIGDFHLGPNDFVMAAGNRETDKGATFKMPTPLLNRFIHVELRHDFDDWLNMALGREFDARVVGYLTFAKIDLFDFNPRTVVKGFPTPRTWEYVSDLIKGNPNVPTHILNSMVGGCVGEAVGVKFNNYYKMANELPNPTLILDGKIKEFNSANVSVQYALITGLCYELRDGFKRMDPTDKEQHAKWYSQVDNFIDFAMKHLDDEMVILGIRTIYLFKIKLETKYCKNWKAFADKHGSVILKA